MLYNFSNKFKISIIINLTLDIDFKFFLIFNLLIEIKHKKYEEK